MGNSLTVTSDLHLLEMDKKLHSPQEMLPYWKPLISNKFRLIKELGVPYIFRLK